MTDVEDWFSTVPIQAYTIEISIEYAVKEAYCIVPPSGFFIYLFFMGLYSNLINFPYFPI